MKRKALKQLIRLAQGNVTRARTTLRAAEDAALQATAMLVDLRRERARAMGPELTPLAAAFATSALDEREALIARPRLAEADAAASAALTEVLDALRERRALERLAELRRLAHEARLHALETQAAGDAARTRRWAEGRGSSRSGIPS